MRSITTHGKSPANNKLLISVLDGPGHGGSSHSYEITGFNTATNRARHSDGFQTDHQQKLSIIFQNGTVPEAGVNGVTQEALLAVVIDRLQGFQSGQFACEENQVALDHCEAALNALLERTAKREARGVEGKHVA
jgi:hypothetical protein